MTMVILIAAVAMAVAFATSAGAVVSTGLLTKGLRSEFLNRFMATPTQFERLAMRIASNANREDYKWLGSVPQVREFGTGRLAKGLRTESYSVENQKYEATLEVDRDEISDDQTGQIRIRVQELAGRAATHKDLLIGQLLALGDDSGSLAYDGKPFFSTTHESGGSGAQDNDLAAGASDPTNVTSLEFRDSVRAAIAAMAAYKDDQGQPMMTGIGGLICVVPPQLYFPAREALSAAMLENTSNTISGIAEPLMFPWLTVGDEWYLLKTDGAVRPFIFQDREPIEFTALDRPDDEQAFNREKYLYGVRARYRMAYGYWQYAVKSTFS